MLENIFRLENIILGNIIALKELLVIVNRCLYLI